MGTAFRVVTLFLLAMSAVGCSEKQSGQGVRFLLPWLDPYGVENLQEMEIPTLTSIHEVQGPVAMVYTNVTVSTLGFNGSVARPNLTQAGSLYIPEDVESSLALTAYAHMERIFDFDKNLGVHKVLSWPRKIGVNISTQTSSGQDVVNNATYFSEEDVIAFQPTISSQVPMALNPGVIAHEHFHAHFNYQVIKRFSSQVIYNQRGNFNNDVILRGWNEGIADYYGYVYSGLPKFLGKSVDARRVKGRDLDGDIVGLPTMEKLWNQYAMAVSEKKNTGGMAYALGSRVSKILYGYAELGTNNYIERKEKHKALLAKVLKNLPNLLAGFEDFNTRLLSPNRLFQDLFLQEELHWRECAYLKKYVEGLEFKEGQCDF